MIVDTFEHARTCSSWAYFRAGGAKHRSTLTLNAQSFARYISHHLRNTMYPALEYWLSEDNARQITICQPDACSTFTVKAVEQSRMVFESEAEFVEDALSGLAIIVLGSLRKCYRYHVEEARRIAPLVGGADLVERSVTDIDELLRPHLNGKTG